MMRDYFGYDPEVPAGFQDADLEMRELEDRAQEERERERRKRADYEGTGNFDGFTSGSDADSGL